MLGSPDGEPILNPRVMCLYICNNNTEGRWGVGGGGLVPARKVRDRRFVPCSGIQVSKKQKVPPCSIVNIEYCGQPP